MLDLCAYTKKYVRIRRLRMLKTEHYTWMTILLDNLALAFASLDVRGVLALLKVECTARTLPLGKCRYAVIILQLTVLQCIAWLNQHIHFRNKDMELVTEETFYLFLGVMFYSHNTGVSLIKAVGIMNLCYRKALPPATTRFILTHLVAFSPTVHMEYADNGVPWESQRDMAP